MGSFKAYFIKEIKESIRNHKYLILAVGFIFWALLDPLMLKLLPLLLKNYMPVDVSVLFSTFTRDTAFQTFLKDLFQIGSLFIIFTLMGIISNEVYSKNLVFPYSRGLKPAGMVIAKYTHYLITISLFILIAFLTNYLYIIKLFSGGLLSISVVFKSSLLYIIYYAVLLSFLLYLSSLFKRSIIPGIITLVFAYSLSILNQFKTIRNYFPNYLFLKAADIKNIFDSSLIPTVIISFCVIILLVYLSILHMKKIDIA
jgi:ABC-2 type transport system permease protein